MQFLMGLNDSFATVRGSILMMSPLPDTRKAHALVLQQERQTEVATKREDGHSNERCFLLHGYPPKHPLHGKDPQPKWKKPTAHNSTVEERKPTPTVSREKENDANTFTDLTTRKTIGSGRQSNGLYYLTASQNLYSTNHISRSPNLWHQRLGHPSNPPLHLLSKSMPEIFFNSHDFCDVCPLAKQTRLPFSKSIVCTSAPFDLIHCDIWGPHKIYSFSGARYFLTIVDDFSRYTWVHLMHQIQI
ncbi:hypothetical protein UlMin_041361 [Ulmus minor]